jgi:hypothetical protein
VGKDSIDIAGGKGTANLVQKCKFCSRAFNVTISDSDFRYTSNDSETFKQLCIIETRGVELLAYEFCPKEDEYVISSGNTQFSANLSDQEFYDVDDSGNEVSIPSIETVLLKK